mmetsp:Transcript_8754/g.8848  ORF Transcript_8754/g.8848 Transcript_8754/m.8848 type:complete len:140 (+) Transcript_8754:3-422(+)
MISSSKFSTLVEAEVQCDEKEDPELERGYCHFNKDGNDKVFNISVFGYVLNLRQDPAATYLGHGAVVWDAAVVLAKYMEYDPRKFSLEKLKDKKVLELGSGCGLGGISYMLRGAVVTLTDLKSVTDIMTKPNTSVSDVM